ADYAVWQREALEGQALKRQLVFWKEQLRGSPAVLDMPTDKRRPAAHNDRAARETLTLDNSLTRALEHFSRGEEVSLSSTLLTAYANPDIPFERLAEELQSERTLGEARDAVAPFVQAMFILQDVPSCPLQLPGLVTTREQVLGRTTRYDLTLSVGMVSREEIL